MKQRDDNYHVKIKPELLFNFSNNFKSAYAPWVYVYLKLDYNNNIFNSPNRFYKIDRNPICEFFNVHPATIARAFADLVSSGLIEKQNNEYRVLNDLDNNAIEKKEGYPGFIQINNNFFIDFIQRFKADSGINDSKDRSRIKTLEVFYYLITRNRHILVDSPVLDSNETVKSISKNLRHDENYVKDYLEDLESLGYIEINDEGKIKTAYCCGTCQPLKKNNDKINRLSEYNKVNSEAAELIPDEYEYNNNEETAEPINISDKPKFYPVSDDEIIRLILMMGSGNAEKTEKLLLEHHISTEAFNKFLETY